MGDLIDLLGPGILLAAPILYAAMGGLFTQRAGIFNIGLEGFMLLAAYFSVAAAVATNSMLVGTLAGVLAATITAALMAVLVVGFRADEVIVGIAVNVLAVGLTTFLLAGAQDTGRRLELAEGYPRLQFDWLKDVPALGPIFNDRDLLVWALVPAAIGVSYIFRSTGFGLRLKAVGEAPLASRAAGVRVAGIRFSSIVISGVFCGLAGAELALGSVHLFSENMTSGRGIIAFAAVIFGAGLVNRTVGACLLFGFAQALAGLLQIRSDFPSQFVLMVPFLLTILAIILSDAVKWRREHRPRAQASASNFGAHEGDVVTIAIVGHLTIDEVRLPARRTQHATTGGAAAYAALGAFLVQGDAVIVGRVGNDYPIRNLQLKHVDGGHIDSGAVTVVPTRSIHNIAHYQSDGSRAFEIENRDVLFEQTPRPADLANLDVAGVWVLVAPAELEQQKDLVETLRGKGALIALDTEVHYLAEPDSLDRLRELTRSVDCFLPSLEHIQHLFGIAASDPGELQASIAFFECALTIVKCGQRGAVVFDKENPAGLITPAVTNLEVVDPTGAGDGFNGGCLVGLARGERPGAAAITGCIAASFVIQSVGVAVPETFSNQERATRYRQCSATNPITIERSEHD